MEAAMAEYLRRWEGEGSLIPLLEMTEEQPRSWEEDVGGRHEYMDT